MTKNTIVIATRKSPLALWQAGYVKSALETLHPQLTIGLLPIATSADKILSSPLYKVGGKGLFVKELEEAVLSGDADVAVHSMKDLPMNLPSGLMLAAMCARENPCDAFVSEEFASLADLPAGARIGTSSLRRQSQILLQRPDLTVNFLRGNVNTRVEKLARGEYDAIILAACGLQRLGLGSHIRMIFSTDIILPAAGQGVLGIECRSEDQTIPALVARLNDHRSAACVNAERAVCRILNGGCHAPIAAYAELIEKNIFVRALVASPDGKKILRAEATGELQNAEQTGAAVANDLLAQGAQELLENARNYA